MQHLLGDDAGIVRKLTDDGYLVFSEGIDHDGGTETDFAVASSPPPSVAVILPMPPAFAADNFDGK